MFNTLLPAIRGCFSAAQLSAVLTSATTTFMQGPEEAIDVVQDWELWIKDSDLLVASKRQITDALDDIARAMADRKRQWP